MVTKGIALLFGVDMEHLAWLDSHYRLSERFGHRFVVFPAVAGGMQNEDAEGQFFEVVLELKAAVEGEQNIEVSLRQLDKLIVGGALPVGFAYRGDLVSGQKVTDAGIQAFV
jgi:hypothetical protein